MQWNSSRGTKFLRKKLINIECNYNMTECETTSPSRKSRDRNIVVCDKTSLRDIHIQASREKN